MPTPSPPALPHVTDATAQPTGVLSQKPLMTQLMYALTKLPGIGPKSAQRLAFHILKTNATEIQHLATLLQEVKARVTFCTTCHHITETPLCEFCQDPRRDQTKLVVVEESSIVYALERAHIYRGRYHVLHGAIAMLAGVGPSSIFADDLIERVRTEDIQEVIIATSPTTEGQHTALYLASILEPTRVHVTRIAYGIPVGTDLEFVDDITLAKSLEGRHRMS